RGARRAAPDRWPVSGAAPASVLKRLQEARADEEAVCLSPRQVAEVLGPPQDLPGRAPEVLPGILWEWTKTTTPPEGEAPVEPYFSGIAGAQYSVSLIWRVHVPENGERLWPRAMDREAVDVPLAEVRAVLGDDDLRRLGVDGVTVEPTSAADLRPGDQVVLPADRGLLDAFGWDPAATGPVVDVSLIAHGLPLDARAIERLCGVAAGGLIQTALGTGSDEDLDPAARTEASEKILRAVQAAAAPAGWDPEEWTAFTGALSPQVVEPCREVPRFRARMAAPDLLSSDFDETSLGPDAVELERHGQAVAARARAVAHCIGLPPALADVVEHAGRLHDIGKADRRFQRWLDPHGDHGVLVAKSDAPRHRWETMRVAAGWPRGGRHEDLSARLVRAWLEHSPGWGEPLQRDLLLHLVISHHGKGRPLVPPVADGTSEEVAVEVAGVSVRAPADLGIVDWQQPARFRRLSDRFGAWGLALLEAIVIRSDHAVSAGASAALDAQP
ncbi:MAG: CRISPR-associated endonuclease Cas3'', partial [Acidobacteria bacterium]|nr:CRISPR-associated endonuclease Cas3'' [Acidobacteriota bacterium]